MWKLSLFAVATVLFSMGAPARAGDGPSLLDRAKSAASDLGAAAANIPIPSFPSIRMPSVSMPSLSGIEDAATRQFTEFTADIQATLPTLDRMGYEIASFRVLWALPPKAKLRLRSRTVADDTVIDKALASTPASGLVATAIPSSAAEAKRIQRTLHMGVAIIDVEFAIPPKVKMSFLPGKDGVEERSIEDADVLCSGALTDR